MKFSASLSMLFTEIPFQQRFSEAAGCGFSFVEFWFPFEYGGRELAPVIRGAGVQTALFNLHPGDISQGDWGLIGVPGREDQFKAAVSQAVELAVLLGCKNLNALAGIRPLGLDIEVCYETIRRNLAWVTGQLPDGVTVVLEALNPGDKPGYILSSPYRALSLIKEIDSPKVKLLYDLYHAAVVGCDLMKIIHDEIRWVGHIQVADCPGRHEPGTGEIRFQRLFPAIEESGYEGYVGLEYKPSVSTHDSLTWLQKWAA